MLIGYKSAAAVPEKYFFTGFTLMIQPLLPLNLLKFQHNQPRHSTQCVFSGSLVKRLRSLLTLQINPTFLIKLQRLAGFMAAFQANYFHPVVGETFRCLWMWWEGELSWGLLGSEFSGYVSSLSGDNLESQ